MAAADGQNYRYAVDDDQDTDVEDAHEVPESTQMEYGEGDDVIRAATPQSRGLMFTRAGDSLEGDSFFAPWMWAPGGTTAPRPFLLGAKVGCLGRMLGERQLPDLRQ